ncbi:hypothetical protein BGZ76_009560 [Entomortierella beljakovae]|nr:hypothetical protein BGZ76_009560 [Entomortierella beljakovae]
MAKVNNILSLVVFAMFLNVVMAWTCYCVDCGSSSCVHKLYPTQFTYNQGPSNWVETYNGEEFEIYNVLTDQKNTFYELCKKNGAMGVSISLQCSSTPLQLRAMLIAVHLVAGRVLLLFLHINKPPVYRSKPKTVVP